MLSLSTKPIPIITALVALLIPFGISTQESRAQCAADIDESGIADSIDLTIMLAVMWTDGGAFPRADTNDDGIVDHVDLAVLLAGWGPCPPPLPWATTLEQDPNPLVVTDVETRERMTATGLPWRVRDDASGIEMLLVPPGTFVMGASDGDSEATIAESPPHQVTITQSFYLGRTEVTQAIWVAEMGWNPSYFGAQPSQPVDQVSWSMIQPFCNQNSLRLPTEAEWEFACRAGDTTPRYGTLDDIGWHHGNSLGTTHVVGGKMPNGLGFYDMLGNVGEWCSDWIGGYSSDSQTDPTGPESGSGKVMRGGAAVVPGSYSRASGRIGISPSSYFTIGGGGFRVARNP